MIPTIIVSSLHGKFEDDQLMGINVSYADYLLLVETDEWKTQASATVERFGTSANKQPTFAFAGMYTTHV